MNLLTTMKSCLHFKNHFGALAAAAAVGLILTSSYVQEAIAKGADGQSSTYTAQFFDPSAVDPTIPEPSSIIGHGVGEKAVRYDPLMRYLEMLSASSDRMTMQSYGKTYEGRTMVHLFITSPENHRRLEQIQEDNGKLADPRKLASAEAGRRLLETHPGVL